MGNELWRILSPTEIEMIFGKEGYFIPPGALMSSSTANYSDPKYTVSAVINYLKTATGQPQSVVVHALIVNSGSVQDALDYIKNPRGFCASRNKQNQIWTPAEDKILLDKEAEEIRMLEIERGADAVQQRLSFLES